MATVDSTNVRTLDSDQYDELTKRAAQLTALLGSIYGEGFESFSNLCDIYRDNVLWLAADLAREIKERLDSAYGASHELA